MKHITIKIIIILYIVSTKYHHISLLYCVIIYFRLPGRLHNNNNNISYPLYYAHGVLSKRVCARLTKYNVNTCGKNGIFKQFQRHDCFLFILFACPLRTQIVANQSHRKTRVQAYACANCVSALYTIRQYTIL